MQDERETVHLSDDHRRVCMAETKTITGASPVGSPTTHPRFQLDNHLGTCSVEVTEDGSVISYEEYHPYGTSAYRAQSSSVDVSAKRYRYTGKERDDETGLYYHGARYYAPWLGRWTAADPLALADGTGGYTYVACDPVGASDPNGKKKIRWNESTTQDTETGVISHAGNGYHEAYVPGGPQSIAYADDKATAEAPVSTRGTKFTKRENDNWVRYHEERGLPVPMADGTTRPPLDDKPNKDGWDIAKDVATGVGKGLWGLAKELYKLQSGVWIAETVESLYSNVKAHGWFRGVNLALNPFTQGALRVAQTIDAIESEDYEAAAENVTTAAGMFLINLIAKGGGAPRVPRRINYRHVFHGEINRRGKAVGFHHERGIGHQSKARVTSRGTPDANGVYTGTVEIYDSATGTWTAKNTPSTFFPQNWTRPQVAAEIRGAFEMSSPVPGRPNNYWEGVSPSGVRIGGYTNRNGDINTAFPIRISD